MTKKRTAAGSVTPEPETGGMIRGPFTLWLDRLDNLLRDQHGMTIDALPAGLPLLERYEAGDSPARFLADHASALEQPWRPN